MTSNASKQPTVLVVSGTPPPYSGPEIMTAHLLNSSLRDRYQLVHFDISKGRDIRTKARFDAINVLYGIIQPLQLLWLMLRNRPDLVYTNLAQNLGGFLRYTTFILPAALFRVPVVVRVMGDGFGHFYAHSSPPLRALIRIVLSNISCFIVRAERLKAQFAGLVDSEQLCVVYSGIDVDEYDQLPDKSHSDAVRVLFVGYLTQAKGALDLLYAIPKIRAACPDIEFQLMGPRLDIERNISYINNPASNNAVLDQILEWDDIRACVRLLGVQSGKEKVSTFVNADVFVLPSYAEAFPTVVLEAMAAGLPVVATPVGALPEAFSEEQILFVPPGDLAMLAEVVTQLAKDSDLRKSIGSRNRSVARSNYDLESHALRMDEVFRNCMREAKTTRRWPHVHITFSWQ